MGTIMWSRYEVIVYNNRVLTPINDKCNTINATFIDSFSNKTCLNALWKFCKTCQSGDIIAIADTTLSYIIDTRTRLKNTGIIENLGCTLPRISIMLFKLLQLSSLVISIYLVPIWSEIRVSPRFSSCKNIVDFFDRRFHKFIFSALLYSCFGQSFLGLLNCIILWLIISCTFDTLNCKLWGHFKNARVISSRRSRNFKGNIKSFWTTLSQIVNTDKFFRIFNENHPGVLCIGLLGSLCTRLNTIMVFHRMTIRLDPMDVKSLISVVCKMPVVGFSSINCQMILFCYTLCSTVS